MIRYAIAGAGLGGICLALMLVPAPVTADDDKPAKDASLVVIDAKGKEVALKAWKFTSGTTHLSWLADRAKKAEEKDDGEKSGEAAPRGPEALAFREEKSTTYQEGILTFVPLANIRALDYDNDKKTVALKAVNPEGKDQTLTGSTKYKGINKLTLEADVDLGELGKAAVKFQGGALDKGIRGLRFSHPKPAPATSGRPAKLVAQDKEEHAVYDLLPLYRVGDDELKTAPTLFFKTTVKIDVGKIKKLQQVESDEGEASRDFRVTLADGKELSLSLLTRVEIDKMPATLQGLVARVPVGYKLFPVHTIGEVRFGSEKEKEKEKNDKREKEKEKG